MSKEIDERVVSMQFDNKQFEAGAKQTMSTLEKLKAKLNFNGASKGLETLGTVASKVDMSTLGKSVDAVSSRFSALEIFGVTALANLSLQAQNAATRIVKAFTIDPIKTGFQEYETQLNSVQTILANTQSKGSTLEDVNAALDELNKYADQTIYNFTEMTRNIGTFTAAGVDLDKSVTSIKGIANLAAVSGSNAQQASTAMYQLSQALAAGRVSLMDWNSVVNAGMGGELFQNALVRTAAAMNGYSHNVDAWRKANIDSYGSFRDSLTKGAWLTADVLTETLTQLSGAYTKTDLIAQGFTESQADEIVKLAETAVGAATDVKTFTQLMDTLKEAVQSGWAQTWEIIIGDFEEAKELWSNVSGFFGGIIEEASAARNNLLGGALTSNWKQFANEIRAAGVDVEDFKSKLLETGKANGLVTDEMIEKAGSFEKSLKEGWLTGDMVVAQLKEMSGATEDYAGSTEDLNKKLEYFQKVVSDVWRGDYKNGKERIDALTAAGYKYAEVQTLVNRTVDGHKLTLEDLSYVQMEALGYTTEEMKAIKALADEAEKSGSSINELIYNLTKPSGRELLFSSIANAAQPVVKVLGAIKEAWRDAFPPMQSQTLYGIIEAVHSFTECLVMSDETVDKVTRTLKGLFAVVDILATTVGGGFKMAFKGLTSVLQGVATALGYVDILSFTASIGDMLVGIRDWVEQNNFIFKGLEAIGVAIGKLIGYIINFVKSIGDMPAVVNAIDKISKGFKKLGTNIQNFFGDGFKVFSDFLDRCKELDGFTFDNFLTALEDFKNNVLGHFLNFGGLFEGIPDNLLEGLINGLNDGASKVWEAIKKLGEGILTTIKTVLGIHSPSVEAHEIGSNFIIGLYNGIKEGIGLVIKILKALGEGMIRTFQDMNLQDIFVAGSVLGFGMLAKKFLDILSLIEGPFEAVTKLINKFSKTLDDVGDVLDAFAGKLKAEKWKVYSESLFTVAKAIALIAGALIIMSKMDQGALWSSVGVIGAIAGGLVLMMKVLEKVDIGKGLNFGKLSILVISLSISVSIMASAMKKIASIDSKQIESSMGNIMLILVGLSGMLYAYGAFVKDESAASNIDKAGKMFLKLSVGLAIIALVMKLVSGMDWADMGKAAAGLAGLGVFFAGMIAVTKFAGDKDLAKVGSMLLKMAAAIGVLGIVIRLITTMSWSDLGKAGVALTGIGIIFAGIIAVSKLAGANASKAGSMLMKMSIAIGILALAIRAFAGIKQSDINKGIHAIGNIAILFLGFTIITNLAGENASKAGSMMLKMAAAIGILVIVIKMFSKISVGDLVKGLACITAMEVLFGAIIAVSVLAGDNASKAGNMLLKMSAAILILVGAIAILSLLKPEEVAVGTLAIMGLIGMFTYLIKATEMAKDVEKTIMNLTIAIGVIAAAIAILSILDPASVVIATACISAVMGMFAFILKSTSVVQSANSTILLIAAVIGGLAGVLYLMSGLPVESTIANATALSLLLGTMAVTMTLMSKVGIGAKAAVGTLAVLTAAIGGLAVILGIMSAMDVQPSIGTALSLSILLLSMAAVTAILSTFSAAAPAALTGALAFDGVIVVIGGLMAGIGALMTYVPQMEQFLTKGIETLNQIASGIGSFFGNIAGGFLEGMSDSFPGIAENLSLFMQKLEPFIAGANNINPKMIDGIKALAEAVLIITAANFVDGLTRLFGGESSITEFGSKLGQFGKDLKTFAQNVEGINPEEVTAAANAAKALAQMASYIPNEGGLLSLFSGENDMTKFGASLGGFGKGVKAFADEISGIDPTTITAGANAGKTLAQMAKEIPNTGGLVSALIGDNDISTFKNQLQGFGAGIANFSKEVESVVPENINKGAEAGKTLAAMASAIPNEGGLMGLFGGSNDMSVFALNLTTFGDAVKNFSLQMSGVQLSSLSNIVVQLSNVMTQLQKFANVAGKALTTTFKNIQPQVIKSVQTMLKAATNEITKHNQPFSEAGRKLIESFAKAVMNQKSNTMNAMKTTIDSAVKYILNNKQMYYNNFQQMGLYMMQGLVAGINAGKSSVINAAVSVAVAAYRAAIAALGIASPSKKFYEIGMYAGMGLTNALNDYADKTYIAGRDMANSAKSGLSDAMSRINDYIDSDIDMQPVIRPVLDLSNLSSGAGAINGLFGMQPSLGLLANVGSISAMMNGNQNGDNSDIVSAIKDLKNSLDNASGDTYNFGDFTYDDGSNISGAIRDLMRAAKMERRT